jgi:hypothetical protein
VHKGIRKSISFEKEAQNLYDTGGFDGGRTRARTLDPLIKRKRVPWIIGDRERSRASISLEFPAILADFGNQEQSGSAIMLLPMRFPNSEA